MGAELHVRALQESMSWKPAVNNYYDTMSMPYEYLAEQDFIKNGIQQMHAYECKKAILGDLDKLMPIAEAYERSEVLTPIHHYDHDATSIHQEYSLKNHVVYIITHEGRIIARAQSNAKGLNFYQLGGVYVEPAHRGLGLGKLLIQSILADFYSIKKGVCLFVKKNNLSAIRLYSKLGLIKTGDYVVSYFI